ncbi:hypothetical protein HJFPF1_05299 [Paramyrothecium foliicola]|nr:hypothetical protein HJFPF1_05299 [Paramyrothecium foliicola]
MGHPLVKTLAAPPECQKRLSNTAVWKPPPVAAPASDLNRSFSSHLARARGNGIVPWRGDDDDDGSPVPRDGLAPASHQRGVVLTAGACLITAFGMAP